MDTNPPTDNELSALRAADQERLSQRLREAREYLGLSQEFVAEQLDIPRAAVSAMETGKRKVSCLELKQLARLYRRSYAYFLEPEDDMQAEEREQEKVAAALYRTTKELSTADRQQVLQFAEFLRQAGSPPSKKES